MKRKVQPPPFEGSIPKKKAREAVRRAIDSAPLDASKIEQRLRANSDRIGLALRMLADAIAMVNELNGWDRIQTQDWKNGGEGARKLLALLALIHSEVSEAVEAVRKWDGRNFEEELADIVIRVLDASEGLGIDMGEQVIRKIIKNSKRGLKHGGKAI